MHEDGDLYLKSDHDFPEAQHMDVLMIYLQDKDAKVEQIKNPGNTEHLCQFSGGSDLFINRKKLSVVVLHVHSNKHRSPLSPVHKNEHLSGLTVEGKN